MNRACVMLFALLALLALATGCPSSPAPPTSAASATATPVAPATPAPPSADDRAAAASASSDAPTLGASQWETKRWRVVVTTKPELADFPAGTFRGATRVCLETELHVPPHEDMLGLELSMTGDRITRVAQDGLAAPPHDLPATLVPCLEKQYAKIRVPKAPKKISLMLELAPAD